MATNIYNEMTTAEKKSFFTQWFNRNPQLHRISTSAFAMINSEYYGYSVKVDGKTYRFADHGGYYTKLDS